MKRGYPTRGLHRLPVPLALACVALVCLASAGTDSLGKLALLAGGNGLAARLFDDPVARGVALYRAGDFAGADAAFTAAGRSATYDRGLSLAATGNYALSVAYFDAVLFADPNDAWARENRDRVAAHIDPVTADSNVPGRIAALVEAARAERAAMAPESRTSNQSRLARKPDPRGVAASGAWLDTLADSPGEYLERRLKAEYDRRAARGLVVPEGPPRW